MDWILNINNALEFIEKNLTADIKIEDVAKIANSSKYHFSRTFKIITNKTIKEYIRERRISLATQELVTTDKSVSYISEKYKYESPAAFSKAFKRYNGVSPQNVKKKNITVFASPKLKIEVLITGKDKLQYEIKIMDEFKITGYKKNCTHNSEIRTLWKDVITNNKYIELKDKSELIGVSFYWRNNNNFQYLIGKESLNSLTNIELSEIVIPESKWAIFSIKDYNEDKIYELWDNINRHWFHATNFNQLNSPVVEKIKNKNFEIWIPIDNYNSRRSK